MIIDCDVSGIIDVLQPARGLQEIAEAGFTRICCSTSGCPAMGADAEKTEQFEAVREILHSCSKQNLTPGIIALPATEDAGNMSQERMDELLRFDTAYLHLAEEAGCHSILVRPLPQWEASRWFYLALAKQCSNADTMLLSVNCTRDFYGHRVRGVMSEPEEAVAWIDRLNREAASLHRHFGLCMDAGACNLCGTDMQNYAVTLGDRIKAVILRENDGQSDASMLPFTEVHTGQCMMDWQSLTRGLQDISFDGELILDMSSTARSFSAQLRPQLLTLAAAVTRSISRQIADGQKGKI